MKSFSKNKKIYLKAFSFIELLVSVSIFSIIAVVSMGAVYSAQNINTRTQQTQVILDGMNLSMEQMVRDIRYGSSFHCGGSILNMTPLTTRLSCAYPSAPGDLLAFMPSGSVANDIVVYYLSNGHIMRHDSRMIATPDTQVTANDVNIKTLHFFVKGAEGVLSAPADYNQPFITVVVSGVTVPSKPGVSPVRFNLETGISSRRLDN